MTREIKFRVWEGEIRQMSHVSQLQFNGNTVSQIIPSIGGFTDLYEDPEDYLESTILIQFTGLLDKNGQEIYEGDILSFGFDALKGKVQYGKYVTANEQNEDILGWMIMTPLRAHALDPQASWEIIGNIYENPELIN